MLHANGTLQSNGEIAVTISVEMPEEYLELDFESFRAQVTRDTAALRAKGWKIKFVRGPEIEEGAD